MDVYFEVLFGFLATIRYSLSFLKTLLLIKAILMFIFWTFKLNIYCSFCYSHINYEKEIILSFVILYIEYVRGKSCGHHLSFSTCQGVYEVHKSESIQGNITLGNSPSRMSSISSLFEVYVDNVTPFEYTLYFSAVSFKISFKTAKVSLIISVTPKTMIQVIFYYFYQ